MKIYRRGQSYRTTIVSDEEKRLLDILFLDGDLLFIFHIGQIEITKKDDKAFYNAFYSLLEEQYVFKDNENYQEKDRIVWLSDYAGGFHNKAIRDKYPSMIIDKCGDSIYLSCIKNNKIVKDEKNQMIIFSPMLGAWSRNIDLDSTFQEDVIREYCKAYKNEIKKPLAKLKEKFRRR